MQMDNTTVSTAGRSYDTFGRIASISNGTDTLSYTYRPGGQLSLSGWKNGQNVAMSNQSYEYDQYNRLTGIKLNNVNEVSYTLNAKDQRTAATYANAGLWNFTYDDKGQVTGANGSNRNYTYSYDGIGNRLTANENSAVTNYTSNLLNQYTLINSAVPNYDADGNMTTSGNGWAYTYNGENRITQATKGSTSVTMTYDYAGRRISKTVSESGVVQNAHKYVYDGFKLIAVYNNNDLVMTFTWQPESLGMDVPVSMTYNGATYYYVTDGNKNVTALLDASGNRVAEYVYGPFGQTVSATGSMAQINPFRFSSEFHDGETGLVYYNYRYYSPELGRWTKRDPIEEEGGANIYFFCHNSALHNIDLFGLNDMESIIIKGLGSGWNESTIVLKGKTAVKINDELFYLTMSPKDGMYIPKSGSTTSLFLYKDNPNGKKISKMLRVDYHEIPLNSSNPRVWHTNVGGGSGIAKIHNSKILDHYVSPRITRFGKSITIFKYGGKMLFIAGVSMTAVDIYKAENRTRETLKQVNGWLAATTLARIGARWGIKAGISLAMAGGQAGPQVATPEELLTVPIFGFTGGVLGGFIGGSIGFFTGAKTTETVYDWIFTPLEKEEWKVYCEQ